MDVNERFGRDPAGVPYWARVETDSGTWVGGFVDEWHDELNGDVTRCDVCKSDLGPSHEEEGRRFCDLCYQAYRCWRDARCEEARAA